MDSSHDLVVADSEDRTVVDMSGQRPRDGALEVQLKLPAPRGQIQVRLPEASVPGRAEAQHGSERWAAKHYWSIDDRTVAYEFDGPLPAGELRLRVPVSAR
jgi:hypothetical protein